MRKVTLKYFSYFFCVLLALSQVGCSRPNSKNHPALFTKVNSDSSGINFVNKLPFDERFNIYTYRNYYNGGGVAAGDVNNDGLVDLYFTSNLQKNKLYLNRGNFRFEDITERAGVFGTKSWSTGVSMADVNGDGWLDIYVCNSGDIEGGHKENELFINNGDLTFTERASEFKLDDRGFTTHAAFFDFDRDNDLDLYILNNSYHAIGSFNLRKNERPLRDSLGGDKLMRNDGDHFTDVSIKAGIYGSIIGFGLGVTIGDVNKDGWQDIYVSNDFFERDYLYINQQNGTFKENLTSQLRSISGASMGADVADINNDGYLDFFVTEMLPSTNERLKTVTTFEDWNRYQYNLTNDYYHQFTRNMLQLNNGNGTFSEIGRLARVEATDWSWGALMADLDNDGRKDIFVANGIARDLTNQDYLQFASSEEFVKTVVSGNKVQYQKLVDAIPSHRQPNFVMHNEGSLGFINRAEDWGFAEATFSNGSAYVDLDNDGDLDLAVNNVDMEASIYRNNTEIVFPENRYLKLVLRGEGKNTYAFGAKITLYKNDTLFFQEQMPVRGFESTVDHRLNFGLGKIDQLDSIKIEWPSRKVTILKNITTNQTLALQETNALGVKEASIVTPPTLAFIDVTDQIELDYKHQENEFVDFDRDRLTFHMLSTEGPKVCIGDVNGDGLDDFYIGGAKEQPGKLFVQDLNGKFKSTNESLFLQDRQSEDIDCTFFDADQDGDQDIYVCSGGNEFSSNSSALSDRLYINDGKGKFSKSNQLLPVASTFESSSTVKVIDYDEDGDLDLFVGVRLLPFYYGYPVNGFLLNNNGKGFFSNVTDKIVPGLTKIGMITDAAWSDVDGDKDWDLLVVGEYMPISVFIQQDGKFENRTETAGLGNTQGWWNCIEAHDVDKDGDIDFVAGNHGLNSRFRASEQKPVDMWVSDFDQNGTVEQIICTYEGDKSYPMVLRHDLLSQIPSLKKKYLKYESYKNQTITDIFSEEQLKSSVKAEAKTLVTSIILNNGAGQFEVKALPIEAQFSPVYGISIDDYDKDGLADILLGGNIYRVKPEVGRYDASYGTFLRGDGKGNFKTVLGRDCGLKLEGEARDIKRIKIKGQDLILIARNNESLVVLKPNK